MTNRTSAYTLTRKEAAPIRAAATRARKALPALRAELDALHHTGNALIHSYDRAKDNRAAAGCVARKIRRHELAISRERDMIRVGMIAT